MIPIMTEGDPVDWPIRVRLLGAVPPVAFALLAVGLDPRAWVAVAALLAVSPWLLTIARVHVPAVVCTIVPIAGVAWMMSDWRVTDMSLMLFVYFVGQQGLLFRRRTAVISWLLAIAVPIGWAFDGYDRGLAWVIGLTFAVACGIGYRQQVETMHRLESAQAALAEQAVGDERRRIAREVHDLVAHSLAVTMLHLTGARLALADGETAEAEAALESAEKLGRSSMTGIRQAVGLLADPAEAMSWGPEPDVRDLPALIEDYTRAGVQVTITNEGAPVDLEPPIGLTVFRLVQESLANAARHAPGEPVHIQLTWNVDQVLLSVRNPVTGDRARHEPGHGLLGMRERVEQLGGQFDAGSPGAIWVVTAELPTTIVAETASR